MEYVSTLRLLLLKPHEFFAGTLPLENYQKKLLFVLPAAVVFAVSMAWQAGNPLALLLYLVAFQCLLIIRLIWQKSSKSVAEVGHSSDGAIHNQPHLITLLAHKRVLLSLYPVAIRY